jgi:hypothetical protein
MRPYSHGLMIAIGFVFLVTGCKPEAERLREAQADAAANAAPSPPPMQDQVAKTGVGVKGDSLNDIQGNDPRLLIAGPVKAYFNVREKVVFEIGLPKAEQMFNALNGRNPKSHDEYMKEVVKANAISLPELPQGMVYRYHVDTNELWVEAEKKAP